MVHVSEEKKNKILTRKEYTFCVYCETIITLKSSWQGKCSLFNNSGPG